MHEPNGWNSMSVWRLRTMRYRHFHQLVATLALAALLGAVACSSDSGSDESTGEPDDAGWTSDTSVADTGVDARSQVDDAGDARRETGPSPDTDPAPDATPLGCPFGDADISECRPPKPLGTPADECPSERYTASEDFDGDGVCLPEEPEPPETPNWSCPADWESRPAFVDEAGDPAVPEGLSQYSVCRPPSPPDDCTSGFFAPAGADDCRRQGLACPSSGETWPDASTIEQQAPRFTGEIRYVDPGASTGGSGTRADPYATASTALADATDGDILALGTGQYDETLSVDREVGLVGSCAEQTRLRAPSGSDATGDGVLEISGTGRVTVANLAIGGERTGIVVDGTSETTTLRGLAVEQTRGVGLYASGADDLDAEALAIRETGAGSDGEAGFGIRAEAGSEVVVDGAEIRGNRTSGLHATGAATQVTLRDGVVAETRPRESPGEKGRGISVRSGARLVGARLLVADNYGGGSNDEGPGDHLDGAGLFARGSDTSVEVTDVVVAATRSNELTGLGGEGVEIRGGAALSATRLLVRDNHDAGLFAGGDSTEIEVDRALVAHTRPWETAQPFKGEGLEVAGSASVRADKITLHASHTNGVIAAGPGSLELTDAIVSATDQGAAQTPTGRGLYMQEGAQLEATRLAVRDNLVYGVLAEDDQTALTLQDADIAHTRPGPDLQYPNGVGLRLSKGADLDATRLAVRRNPHIGIYSAREGTDLEFTDVLVADNRPEDSSDPSGTGMYVSTDADLEATRFALIRNHQRGLIVGGTPDGGSGDGTNVTLTDTVVDETQPDPGDDANEGGGLQVGYANLEATRLVLRQNRGFGLGAFGHGSVTLDHALIADTQPRPGAGDMGYGVFVYGQQQPFEFEGDHLRLRDNHTNGFAAQRDAVVTLADSSITGTRPQPEDDGFGDGLYLMAGPDAAAFRIERTLLADNHRAGALVSNRTGEFVDSLLTGNGVGLIREGEVDLDLIRTNITANEQQNEECRHQCYSEPPAPETVSPGG